MNDQPTQSDNVKRIIEKFEADELPATKPHPRSNLFDRMTSGLVGDKQPTVKPPATSSDKPTL